MNKNIIPLESLTRGKDNDPKDVDIIIQTQSGRVLDITGIELDNCNIVSAITKDGYVLGTDEIRFVKDFLYVPGIGFIAPGARIIYEDKDYVLLYGWHKNISNQEIYSWHLKSLDEDIPDKTVYKDMINKIEIVHFK